MQTRAADPGVAVDDLLVRHLGVRQLTAHIFNYTIGSGIFALPAVAAAALGPAAITAYLLCAVVMALVALTFAEASSRVSVTGGAYAFVAAGLGPFPAFLTAVLLCLSDLSAAGAIAMLLSRSTLRLIDVNGFVAETDTIAVLLCVLAAVNIRGVRQGMRLIEGGTVAKLGPLLFFIAVGIAFISPARLRLDAMPPVGHIARTAGVLIFAFSGIEVALTPTGEMVRPAHAIPRASLLALGLVTLLYLAVQTVAYGVMGPALAADTVAPLSMAASTFSGNAGRVLLLAGASVSMFAWLTGSILAGPRLLFALARDGFLPDRLASVHPRFHTPHVAIATYVILTAALALSGTFEQLAVLSNLAAMAVYFLCGVAIPRLRRLPLAANAQPFRAPGGLIVPALLCASMVWLVIATTTRREAVAIGVTLLIAIPVYLSASGRAPASVTSDRFEGDAT